MKSLFLFFLGCTSLIFVSIVLVSCTDDNANVIKIGVVIPITGKLSVMGEVERNGMVLAEKKINESQKKIVIFFEDSKSNPKDAVSAAKKLIDVNKVDVIISSTTGASAAIQPLATSKKVNHIAYCMDSDIAKKSPYTLRFYEGVESEAIAINKYFDTAKAVKKVGLLYNRVEVWDKINKTVLKPHLNQLGIQTPFIEDFQIGEKDFKNIVIKMKDKQIDHLVLLGYGFEFPELFNELKTYGLLKDITIIGGWGFLYSKVSPADLEGVLVAGPKYTFSESPEIEYFSKAYKQAYGTYPNFDAAMGYDVINNLSSLKTSDFRSPVKKIFENQKFKGTVGNYSFDKDGNMVLETSIGAYNNGKIKLLK